MRALAGYAVKRNLRGCQRQGVNAKLGCHAGVISVLTSDDAIRCEYVVVWYRTRNQHDGQEKSG
jgi:hypothetical protein